MGKVARQIVGGIGAGLMVLAACCFDRRAGLFVFGVVLWVLGAEE